MSVLWVILDAFLLFAVFIFSKKINFSKIFQENYHLVSNSLDPDQAQHFVGPDLGPNRLKQLSADNTSRQTVNNVVRWDHFNGITGSKNKHNGS